MGTSEGGGDAAANPVPGLPWQARPIFISSTFRDMQAERDWLRDHVFPRLAEDLRVRRIHLEPIDLRLGVDTAAAGESERELQVLKVCLDEVRRSRPFMLVLLGERYGWIPPAERIADAAREQGLELDPAGKSVTALEIEYGLIRENPGQRQRSLIMLRKPLDLDRIPASRRAEFSDAGSPDPAVQRGYADLQAFKQRLQTDPEFTGHVLEYSAEWDTSGPVQSQHVSGLHAFGELVYRHLRALLEAETRERTAAAPLTWQQQERAELAEFVEHRGRLVIGRDALLSGLLKSLDDASPTSAWATVLTGAPGLGKSAVFAALHDRLAARPGTLLLVNAAGGSTRGAYVESMLRRFIEELSVATRERASIPDAARDDEIDALFRMALHRASGAGFKVVLLLDALDQMEISTRAQHATWIRHILWPSGVRLLATAQPGTATRALQALPGVQVEPLPPLTPQHARQLGPGLWRRYHRQLNPEVLDVLTAKLAHGAPACGNPLWLTLALEQLNLLDSDAFAFAQHGAAGSEAANPAQRLAAFLHNAAARMPADVEGLYQWLLEYAELAHGRALVRGYAAAIAVSRHGWRDADLQVLAPALARVLHPQETILPLDELTLATLRRAFRAHVNRRGTLQQVDFFHAQMRCAVWQRLRLDGAAKRALHRAVNDYLQTLDAADPMVPVERMAQLIGEHDALRAARYYATVDAEYEPTPDRSGATWTLVEWLAGATDDGAARQKWLAGWTRQQGLRPSEVYRLAYNLLFGLLARMENRLAAPARLALAQAAQAALQGLARHDDGLWWRHLSTAHDKVGAALRVQGDLAGALREFRQSMEIRERLAGQEPWNPEWQRGLALSHGKIGDVLVEQGNLAEALREFQLDREIAERLVRLHRDNSEWQRDLSTSQERIGYVLRKRGDLAGALREFRLSHTIAERLAGQDPDDTRSQLDLSVSHDEIGGVLGEQGDGAAALHEFRRGLEIRERLVRRDPGNAAWQDAWSMSHERIGHALRDQGDRAGALREFRLGLEVRERLARQDPDNAAWQQRLAISHDQVGDALITQGDLALALREFHLGLEIRERLTHQEPGNADWQRDLSASHSRIGEVLRAQGDLGGALRAFQLGLEARERLARRDPGNAGWQRDLSVAHVMIGEIRRAQGDLASALVEFRRGHAALERLASHDPGNAAWQRDLSVSHAKIGDVLRDQGDLIGALREFGRLNEILGRLARKDPGSVTAQHDLSVSHGMIGELLMAQGDAAGAQRELRLCHGVLEHLARRDPGNAAWQRDLSVSHAKLGQMLFAQRDFDGALIELHAYRAIADRLAAQDPHNAGWQHDVALSHGMIGDVLRAQGSLDGALRELRLAHEVHARLGRQTPDNAQWQRQLSVSHNRIAELLIAQRDLAGALRDFCSANEILERLAHQDPGNAEWQCDLLLSYARVAALTQPSDPPATGNLWRKASILLEAMTRRGITNVDPRLVALVRQRAGPATGREASRNDRCPCGSGRRYKECHGR